jgi:hypothetical protein
VHNIEFVFHYAIFSILFSFFYNLNNIWKNINISHLFCENIYSLFNWFFFFFANQLLLEQVIILARESGLKLELSDIPVRSLVPEALRVRLHPS